MIPYQVSSKRFENVLLLVCCPLLPAGLVLIVKAFDIQLKVLQALPSLFQNYSNALSGKLLAAALEISFSLYNSKTAVVSNTAAAALQQLVAVTFEKVALEDGIVVIQ